MANTLTVYEAQHISTSLNNLSDKLDELAKDNTDCHTSIKEDIAQIDNRLVAIETEQKYTKEELRKGQEHFNKLNGNVDKNTKKSIEHDSQIKQLNKDNQSKDDKTWSIVFAMILIFMTYGLTKLFNL